MFLRCIAILSLCSASVLVSAQLVTYSTLHPVNGKVARLTSAGIVMEKDGKQMPVPTNRNTRIRVEGHGDGGFIVSGAVVTVSGKIVGRGALGDASVTVHLNPRQTAGQQTRLIRQNATKMTITGTIVNLNPLVINAIDLLKMEIGTGSAGAVAPVPPISPGRIQVELSPQSRERVRLALGNSFAMVKPGDAMTYYYKGNNPNLATLIKVTKSEALQSRAAKAKEAAEKAADEKPAPAP